MDSRCHFESWQFVNNLYWLLKLSCAPHKLFSLLVSIQAKRNAEIQKIQTLSNLKEYPRKKIEIVRRKLSGGHPCQILLDELRHGNAHLKKVANDVSTKSLREARGHIGMSSALGFEGPRFKPCKTKKFSNKKCSFEFQNIHHIVCVYLELETRELSMLPPLPVFPV